MSTEIVAGDENSQQEYQRALREHGIDPQTEIEAPEPMVPNGTFSPEDLCDQAPDVKGAEKVSLPMRLLSFTINEGSADYPGYTHFVSADVWHPEKGYIVLNHSFRRTDGSETPLGTWLTKTLKRGQAFRIGMFKTARGFKVLRPVEIKPSQSTMIPTS